MATPDYQVAVHFEALVERIVHTSGAQMYLVCAKAHPGLLHLSGIKEASGNEIHQKKQQMSIITMPLFLCNFRKLMYTFYFKYTFKQFCFWLAQFLNKPLKYHNPKMFSFALYNIFNIIFMKGQNGHVTVF